MASNSKHSHSAANQKHSKEQQQEDQQHVDVIPKVQLADQEQAGLTGKGRQRKEPTKNAERQREREEASAEGGSVDKDW